MEDGRPPSLITIRVRFSVLSFVIESFILKFCVIRFVNLESFVRRLCLRQNIVNIKTVFRFLS